MMLKMNSNANFKDMLGPSERQSAGSQRRVISITWRDWELEVRLVAGKGEGTAQRAHNLFKNAFASAN
jgi:hypothetical protein